jgi:hypothetical protein
MFRGSTRVAPTVAALGEREVTSTISSGWSTEGASIFVLEPTTTSARRDSISLLV